MHSFNLDSFLSGHVFAFVFIFARIGSALMLFPGIGEAYVSARMRLMLAFAVSLVLMGPLMPRLPTPPESLATLVSLIGYEAMIGIFFGTLLRLLMGVLETVGFIVALQTGLSNATIFNPAMASQSPLSAAFLSVTGLTLVFITGLDHMFLRALVALYDLFPPGGAWMVDDMVQAFIHTMSQTFLIGIELGMPFLVIGLLMYIGLGIMQKTMPQVQLFLVIAPVQIWGGLMLLAITLSGIMAYWLQYCDKSVSTFFSQ